MDIDYKEVIDFSKLKRYLDGKGIKVKFLADKLGIFPNRLSQICKNNIFPKSDMVAKIAFILNVPVSEIVDFKIIAGENKMKWFEGKALPYSPDGEIKGEVTYEPLRLMMNMYLDYLYDNTGKEKTINDLFDLIEPCKRRNGLTGTSGMYKKAMEARGYEEGYKSARDRKYKAKGLIPQIRTKLRNDVPVNMRTIYDICNFFGCSVDWVMSYK